MKITLERAPLLKSLAHVQSVVERRNTIPILSNLLLDAVDGKLSITATDLDIEVVETLNADISEPGATTAPAHVIYDIVRKLPDGAQIELNCSGDSERLEISAGRSQFSLACLPRKDFPVMAGGDMTSNFSMPAGDLKALIDKTRFAISTEETRYYLNGIYLHTCEGDKGLKLRAVATDGHRLALYEMAAPSGIEGMPGVIVPRKTVGEMYKLVDDVSGDVRISVSETKIRFTLDEMVLTSKLIDGTFPDYQRVIPSGNNRIMTVNAKELIAAADRVSTVSSEKSRAVKMALDEGRITLAVTSPEAGSATEELEVNYSQEPMEIGFNARYLLEIAGQIDGEKARFEMQEAGSPTIIREETAKASLYVLMPMRV